MAEFDGFFCANPCVSRLNGPMDCLEIARKLVSIDSVTTRPNADIANWMYGHLSSLAFDVEQLVYLDNAGLEKIALVGRRGPAPSNAETGRGSGIVYCCHNDVVSVDGWNGPHGGPFDAVIADGRLWGRGACDMKGPTAAALAAIARIPVELQKQPIYFLVTGDEESGMQGASTIVAKSKYFADMKATGTVGIIGEPTELRVVNSHKGGCHFKITSEGVAAHSSTADGRNANWALIPFLSYLREQFARSELDPSLLNQEFSPASLSMNVVIKNEPAASNITVGKATCHIFLRPMPSVDWRGFVDAIVGTARGLGLLTSPIAALEPLHTPASNSFVQQALAVLEQSAPESVCYATDGCCLRALENLIVLGPGSIEQAHRSDEWISLEQLHFGVEVYEQMFRRYCL
jgi:acetylornithine deacetylase